MLPVVLVLVLPRAVGEEKENEVKRKEEQIEEE